MKYSRYILILIITLIPLQLSMSYGEKRLHKEKEYQDAWCAEAGGVTEYVFSDNTRVDCLTEEYAIEFDFADKWAEAIGQSLHYARMSGKKPGIVIIAESPGDKKHIEKLKNTTLKNDIKIWVIDNEGNPLWETSHTDTRAKKTSVAAQPTASSYVEFKGNSRKNILYQAGTTIKLHNSSDTVVAIYKDESLQNITNIFTNGIAATITDYKISPDKPTAYEIRILLKDGSEHTGWIPGWVIKK